MFGITWANLGVPITRFRVDATQALHPGSSKHLAVLVGGVRAQLATSR